MKCGAGGDKKNKGKVEVNTSLHIEVRIAPCTLRLDVISWVIVQHEDCVNYSLKRKCTSVRGMRAADPDRGGHVGSFDNETDLF